MNTRKSKKAISVLIVAMIMFSASAGLASAAVNRITITKVDEETGDWQCPQDISHRKDSITFTVNSTSTGIKVNVSDGTVYGLGTEQINVTTGNATFKWDITNVDLSNYTATAYNTSNESDSAVCLVNITNTAPAITAIRVQNTTGWYTLSANENATGTAGNVTNVSVNVTDADGYGDIEEVQANMTAFNPDAGWITLERVAGLNGTTWAVYNKSVEVKKFVDSAGLQITANATDSRDAFNETTSSGRLIVNPAAPYELKIFGPDTSSPNGVSITQWVAIRDQYHNNLTNVGTFSYNVTMSRTVGHATIVSKNPLTIDQTDTDAEGVFTSNFIVNDVYDEDTTIKVTSSPALSHDTKTLTYYGTIDHLEVSLNETSMYANNGADAIRVMVQLKDAAGQDIKSAGETIQITQDTGTGLFGGLGSNDTDANGKTTFVIASTTKSGSDKIYAIATPSGVSGTSDTITVTPIVSWTNSFMKPDANINVKAGQSVSVNVTTKDYGNEPISGIEVTFNITSGNGTLNGVAAGTPVTVMSSSVAEVTFVCSKSGDVNKINATVKDVQGVSHRVANADTDTITIVPNAPTKLAVDPGRSIGLESVNGTSKSITIQLQDNYSNDNTTATANVLITTNNETLGNMTCGSTTVNNNLWCNITASDSGSKTFTYTVNSSVPGTATLTVNVTDYGFTDTITITTSGPTGLNLTVDKKLPLVGEKVTATAQLTGEIGNIAIPNVNITFVLRNPDGDIIDVTTNFTDDDGKATCDVTQTSHGVYTINATDEYGHYKTNTTTYVGNASQIWIAVNNTSPQVNETITVYAIFKDAAGYNSSSVKRDNVNFLADDSPFATSAISNGGVAMATYSRSTAGTVAIDVFYTNATNPYWEGTVAANSTTVTFGKVVVPGAPSITDFSPDDETPTNVTGESGTFSVTVNQTVDVSWYLNESLLYTNESTITASYTNASAVVGVWNVSAIASNANGTAMQMWTWTVTKEPVGVTVTGTVKGINQEILNTTNATTVTIDGYSGATDANGNYSISGVPAGTYNVTASATGYRNETNVSISITSDMTIDFTGDDGLLKEPCDDTTYVLQVINKWAAGEISSTTKVLQQINIWAES